MSSVLKCPKRARVLLIMFLSLSFPDRVSSDEGKGSFVNALDPVDYPSAAQSSTCTSLLQASLHNDRLESAATHSITEADVPKGFRARLGEFCLIAIGVIALIGACLCLSGRKSAPKRCSEQPPDESSPKAGSSEDEAAGGRQSASLQAFAYKEESDAGDWNMTSLMLPYAGESDSDDPLEYDPDIIPKYIETHFSSWKLLLQIAGTLMEFWVALVFMYWSLMSRKEELMDCDLYAAGAGRTSVYHLCHYTRACLSGFPILAANIVLVLMVRNLLQTRLYYSMLRSRFVVVFHSVPLVATPMPWVIGLSMLQGGLHFALKAWFEHETVEWDVYPRMVRKFVLPGTIFFSLLFRYADVENVLVPLNRLAELEVTQEQRCSPWLAKISMMSERVLAFDARHRDVYEDTLANLGRLPTIDDIIQNISENYDHAHQVWKTRAHRHWGLFRSMWPAGLLLDSRLDHHDQDTRSWFVVSSCLLIGSVLTSLLSLYIFLGLMSKDAWRLLGDDIKAVVARRPVANTAITLGNLVTFVHGVVILVLMLNTVRNMFYFTFHRIEVKTSTAVTDTVVRAMSPSGTRPS